ncbi:MAG: cation transporter [Deltaproteobacteria bacterium]|nr:cation transporter [Deltaproteobacteria bacterium]
MAGRNWTRIGLVLVIATMVYNAVEAGLSVFWGYWAHSIALMGFGLDSVIELAAAGVLLWRLRLEERGASEEDVESGERRVQQFVGVTFITLALYVTGQSGWILLAAKAPDESIVGIIIAAASLVIMPLVSWGKLRAARQIGSKALAAEARETLACSYLSLTLLVGLAANSLWGWWWADPVAALLMVPWLVKEGIEGIRGEDDD